MSTNRSHNRQIFHRLVQTGKNKFYRKSSSQKINTTALALGTCDKMEMRSLNILSSIGLKLPDESEMKTAKVYVDSKKCEQNGENRIIKQILEPVKEAFPKVYRIIDYTVRYIWMQYSDQ